MLEKISRGRVRALCLLLMTAAPMQWAYADDFYLSSGKVVQGALQSETDTTYVVQTEVGSINLKKSDVARVVKSGTSVLEVQGDTAASKGDTQQALTVWRQALLATGADSVAGKRLQEKISRQEALTQRAASQEIQNLLAQAQTLVQAQRLDAAQVALDNLQGRLASLSGADALTSQVKRLQAQVYYGTGLTARDNMRLDAAEQALEEAITADPTFYPTYLALGELYLMRSDRAVGGLTFLEDGLELAGNQIPDPERYRILNELGTKAYELKRYAQAATAFAELIPARQAYPEYANVLDKAVDSYTRMGEESLGSASDFRQIIDTLNSALRLNPRSEKTLFLLGRIYLDQGQLENAIVTLQKLLSINGAFPGANLYLGQAFKQAHDYPAAVKHFSSELALSGNSYNVLVDRAEAEIYTGDYRAAKADLDTARSMQTNNWRAFYLGGLLAYNQKDYTTAQKELVEAIQKNPSAVPAMLLMGKVLSAQGKKANAREWLDRVVARLQSEPELDYRYKVHLAEALTILGEMAVEDESPRLAQDYLTQALAVDSMYAPALDAQADALLMLAGAEFVTTAPQQLYKQAEELYLTAIRVQPKEPIHYLKLGRYYQLHGRNFEQATASYNKYVDLGGRDSDVNTWLQEVGAPPRPEVPAPTPVVATPAPGSWVPDSTVTESTSIMIVQTPTPVSGMPGAAAGMPTTTTMISPSAPTGSFPAINATPAAPVPPLGPPVPADMSVPSASSGGAPPLTGP